MARRLPSGSRLIQLLGVAVKEGAIPRGSVHRWREHKRRRQVKEILELLAGIQELVKFYEEVAVVRVKIDQRYSVRSKMLTDMLVETNAILRDTSFCPRFLAQGLDVNVEEPMEIR